MAKIVMVTNNIIAPTGYATQGLQLGLRALAAGGDSGGAPTDESDESEPRAVAGVRRLVGGGGPSRATLLRYRTKVP
jgi:hypothetical protein